MLVVVHSFATWSAALHFEHMWQNVYTARETRDYVAKHSYDEKSGTRSSVRRRLFELYAMLNLPEWCSEKLTISYRNEKALLTSYDLHPPAHMPEDVQKTKTFPSTGERRPSSVCFICDDLCKARGIHSLQCGNLDCQLAFHVRCMVNHLVITADSDGHTYIEPEGGVCPNCASELRWPLFPAKWPIGQQSIVGITVGPAFVQAPAPAPAPVPAPAFMPVPRPRVHANSRPRAHARPRCVATTAILNNSCFVRKIRFRLDR